MVYETYTKRLGYEMYEADIGRPQRKTMTHKKIQRKKYVG